MPSKRTILLIDYDPKSIQDTLGPLTRAGYRVEVAGDGQSGLEVFGKLAPDLVLIEPMVPKKHGFQVCHEIKSTPRGKTTPVLITTAFYRGRKHRLEAQEKYGCDGYLEKPIPEELLLSTCAQFLIDTPGPPLPVERPAPSRASAPGRVPAPRGSVISFPELPLTDDREPQRLVALDDLSDDEIQDRLDHMILEDEIIETGPVRSARGSAAAGPPPAPARPAVEPAPSVPAPASAEAAGPAEDDVRLEIETVAPPAPLTRANAPAGSVAAAVRRGDHGHGARPRRRSESSHVQRDTAAAPRASSRLPLWIGVAAVTCVLVGAGLLWSLREPAVDAADTTAAGRITGGSETRSTETAPAPRVETVEPVSAPETAGPASPPVEPPSVEGLAPAPAGPLPLAGRTHEPPPAASPAPPARANSGTAAPQSARSESPRPTAESRADRPAEPTRRSEAVTPPRQEARVLTGASAAAAPAGEIGPAPLDAEATPSSDPEPAAPAAVTPARAQASRGDLIPLGEVDAGPRILTRTTPDYPRVASQLRQEGTVNLRVLVDENGRVETVEFESGTKHRVLQKEAMRSVESWTYEPATKDGVPVKVWVTEVVTFKL